MHAPPFPRWTRQRPRHFYRRTTTQSRSWSPICPSKPCGAAFHILGGHLSSHRRIVPGQWAKKTKREKESKKKLKEELRQHPYVRLPYNWNNGRLVWSGNRFPWCKSHPVAQAAIPLLSTYPISHFLRRAIYMRQHMESVVFRCSTKSTF
jgi:hypothetical protein